MKIKRSLIKPINLNHQECATFRVAQRFEKNFHRYVSLAYLFNCYARDGTLAEIYQEQLELNNLNPINKISIACIYDRRFGQIQSIIGAAVFLKPDEGLRFGVYVKEPYRRYGIGSRLIKLLTNGKRIRENWDTYDYSFRKVFWGKLRINAK